MRYSAVDKTWFRSRIEQKGLSLRAVAKKMNIEASALSRSLNSERKFKPEEITQLAVILEQPAAEILEHINVIADAASPPRTQGFGEVPQTLIAAPGPAAPYKRHPLFGSMKGTTIVMPGVDLTQPASPDWAHVYDDDYDHGVVVQQQDIKRQ